ncbi:MAG: hypothetical protein AB1499_16850 [Nitrospirota bacterium]
MINKKVLDELKQLNNQRGVITKSQIEYSRKEFRALKDIYPQIKPSEEIRRSHGRTLASYISSNIPSLSNDQEAPSPL